MISMTYGVLPDRANFDLAFEHECPDGLFDIRLSTSDARACENFRLGDGRWTCDELWQAITEVMEYGINDENGAEVDLAERRLDLISSILSMLGFEWV